MFFEQLITIDDSLPPAPPSRRQLSKGKGKGSSDYLKRVMSEADDLLLSTPSPPPPQKDMGALLFTNSNKKALTSNGAPIAPDLSKPSTSAAASADFKTPSSIRVRPPAAETAAAAAAAATTTEPQPQQSSTAAGAEPVRSSTSQFIANNIFNMVDFVDNASPIRALRNNYMRGAADRDDESEGGDMSSQAIEAGSSFANTAPVDRSLITEQDSAVHDQSTTVAEDGQGEGTPVIKQKSGAGKSSTDHRHAAAAAAAALPDDHMLDELQHFNWAANEGRIRSGPSTNKTPSSPKRMKLADQQADHQSAAAISHRDSLRRVDLRPRFEESLSTMELSKEDGGVVVVVASAPALPTGIGGGGGGAHQPPPPPSPFTSLPTSMDGFSRQLAARASLRQQQQTPMQSTPLVPSRAQSRTNRLSSLATPADSLQVTATDAAAAVADADAADKENAPPAANLLDDIDWEDLGEDLIIDEDKAKEAKAGGGAGGGGGGGGGGGEKEERKSSGDFVFDDDEDFEALVNTMLEVKGEQPAAAASTAAEAAAAAAAAAAAPAADINYDDLLSDDLDDFEPLEDQVVVPTATTTSTTTAINPPAVAEAVKVDSSKSAAVAPAAKDVDEEFAFDDDDDDLYALAIPSAATAKTESTAAPEPKATADAPVTTTATTTTTTTTAAIPVADDFDYDSLLDDDLDLESWPLPSTSAASAQPPPEPPEPPLANPFLLPQPETLALRRPKAKPRSRKDLFGKLTTLNDIRKMLRLNGFMDEQKEAAGEGEGEGDGRPGQ